MKNSPTSDAKSDANHSTPTPATTVPTTKSASGEKHIGTGP